MRVLSHEFDSRCVHSHEFIVLNGDFGWTPAAFDDMNRHEGNRPLQSCIPDILTTEPRPGGVRPYSDFMTSRRSTPENPR